VPLQLKELCLIAYAVALELEQRRPGTKVQAALWAQHGVATYNISNDSKTCGPTGG
jgi:hypothetical protein